MPPKIKNGWAIIRCCITFLYKGRARKNGVPKRVLIVQNAKLGDMVCTTPLFRAVKEKYPHSELWVMGNENNRELLAGNKDVDRYVVYEHQKDIDALIAQVRLWHIDAACLTAPEHRLLSVLYLAGIPHIVTPRIENGRSPHETFLYRLLRHSTVTVPHHMGSYAPREYLRLLEPLGISTTNTAKHLFYTKEALEKVREFFNKHGIDATRDCIVGICPSAGNKIKTWPAERFARVAHYAYQKYGARIMVIGGPRDRAEVRDTLAALTIPVIDASESFSLEELKAVIATLHLLIAVDTGPIYIAEAFGVPTIDIIGPIDEHEQPPISDIHRIVTVPGRIPQLHVMNAKIYNHTEARRQTEAISAEMVMAELDALQASKKAFKHKV